MMSDEMKCYLKGVAFPGQSNFLATYGHEIWCEITDAYDLYEPIGAKVLPSLQHFAARYQSQYQLLVARNVAAEHAILNTGTPQVIKRGKHWMLCDEVDNRRWPTIRRLGLRLAGEAVERK